jgi:hypothetical protein
MKPKIILLFCVLLLLLVQGAQAMSSTSFRVDWSNRLTGSGGPASSPGYKVNFTVGQTVSGVSSNPLNKVQWGYWAAVGPGSYQFMLCLPLIMTAP